MSKVFNPSEARKRLRRGKEKKRHVRAGEFFEEGKTRLSYVGEKEPMASANQKGP